MAISHADHDHPNTPAARAACRKRLGAGQSPVNASAEATGIVRKATAMTVVPRHRGDGGVVKGMKAAAGKMIRTAGDVPANLPAPLLYAITEAWERGWGVVEGYRLNEAENRVLVGGTVAQVSLVWNAGGDSGVFVRKLTTSVTHRCDSAQAAIAFASGDEDWPWEN